MNQVNGDFQQMYVPGEDEEQGLDIWGFLKRRKAFVILLGMVGAGIGYMLFNRQIPQYESSAIVQVIHRVSDRTLEKMTNQGLSDAAYEIQSPLLLDKAIANHQLRDLGSLRGRTNDQMVAIVAGMLSVRELSKTVLQITCKGENASDVEQIVNAVAEEYESYQEDTYQSDAEKLKGLLTDAGLKTTDQLTQAENEYLEFKRNAPLSSEGESVHRARVASFQEGIAETLSKEAAMRAELKSLEEAIHNGADREAILLMIGQVDQFRTQSAFDKSLGGEASLASALLPLYRREIQLKQDVGIDHPDYKLLQDEIQLTRRHFAELSGLESEKGNVPEEPRPDFLAVYLQSLRQELQVLAEQRTELEGLAAAEEQKARGFMESELKDRELSKRIERLEAFQESRQMMLREFEFNTDVGGVEARVLQKARYGALVYPKMSQFLGMGAFLGAFAGLVLGYLVEMADKSFRKPEDIVREFGIPILGHVPYMKESKLKSVPDSALMDRTVVSRYLPRSRPAEAYRSVRTAVCFSALGGEHKVIQVTSPAAGDGKSTLAINLAVSLAQSGKRSVLVESDFRRPKVHKLTNVDKGLPGLVDVLKGKADLNDVIQRTDTEDFFVIPCGTRPKNPAELLSRPEYNQLLSVLREKFDYVIVDTPPVLAVTDPCSIAPLVDGVILCTRLSRHTRDLGRRSLEQLRDVGGILGGVVINGVEESDGYGYGNYRYSDYKYYYKNYNYNYTNYYGKKAGGEYYTDEHVPDLDESSTNIDLLEHKPKD